MGTTHPYQSPSRLARESLSSVGWNRSKPRVGPAPTRYLISVDLRLRLFKMDNLSGSFSKLKKKLKHPLRGSKRKPGMTESSTTGGGIGQTSSLPGPEPRFLVCGDEDQGEKGFDVDAGEALQRDEPPTGKSDGHQEEEEDVGRGRRLHPQPDVEPAVGSEKPERVYPSASATLVLHNAKTNGM